MWSASCKSISNIPFLFFYFFFSRASELQNSVAYDCVQLHGGWGYMWEYPIAKWVWQFRYTPLADVQKKENYWTLYVEGKKVQSLHFSTDYRVYSSRWKQLYVIGSPQGFLSFLKKVKRPIYESVMLGFIWIVIRD